MSLHPSMHHRKLFTCLPLENKVTILYISQVICCIISSAAFPIKFANGVPFKTNLWDPPGIGKSMRYQRVESESPIIGIYLQFAISGHLGGWQLSQRSFGKDISLYSLELDLQQFI